MPKSDAEPLISPAASRSNLLSLMPNSEPELLISTSASGSDLPPLMPKSDAETLISPAASRANLPSLMPKPEAEPLMSPAASGSNLPSLMPKSDTEPLRLATPPARTNPQCRHNPRQSSGTCPLPSPQASYLRCPGKRISAHSGSGELRRRGSDQEVGIGTEPQGLEPTSFKNPAKSFKKKLLFQPPLPDTQSFKNGLRQTFEPQNLCCRGCSKMPKSFKNTPKSFKNQELQPHHL